MTFNYRFSIIPAGAIVDGRLTARALQVLCLLGRHTNDQGWCSRSQVKMARELGVGRATVYDALELLAETGWVEKRANGRGGRAPDSAEHPFAAYSYRVVIDRKDAELAGCGLADGETAPPEGAVPAGGGAGQAAGGAAQAAGGAGPEAAPLEGTPSEGILPEDERDARAREQRHGKFARWLSAFLLRWPTAAADDQHRIANAGRDLCDEERAEALAKIPQFLEFQRKTGRKTCIAGWKYLEEKRWTLLPQGPQAGADAGRIAVREGTAQWTIWSAVFRIARPYGGAPDFMLQGPPGERVLLATSELPQTLLAWPAPEQWLAVTEGSGEFAAWLRWLCAVMPPNFVTFRSGEGGRRSLVVPAPWPPRKDGSLSSTGPPGDGEA